MFLLEASRILIATVHGRPIYAFERCCNQLAMAALNAHCPSNVSQALVYFLSITFLSQLSLATPILHLLIFLPYHNLMAVTFPEASGVTQIAAGVCAVHAAWDIRRWWIETRI